MAYKIPVLVAAGNFSLGGRVSSVAQYDPNLKLWVDQFSPHLFIQSAGSAGAVAALSTNRTNEFDDIFMVILNQYHKSISHLLPNSWRPAIAITCTDSCCFRR